MGEDGATGGAIRTTLPLARPSTSTLGPTRVTISILGRHRTGYRSNPLTWRTNMRLGTGYRQQGPLGTSLYVSFLPDCSSIRLRLLWALASASPSAGQRSPFDLRVA